MDQSEGCIQQDLDGGLARLGWVKRGYQGTLSRRNGRSKSMREKMSIAGVRDGEGIILGWIGNSGK